MHAHQAAPEAHLRAPGASPRRPRNVDLSGSLSTVVANLESLTERELDMLASGAVATLQERLSAQGFAR